MGLGLVVYDLLYVTLASALYGSALAAGVLVATALSRWVWLPLCVFPGFLAALLALIAMVGVLSLFCPRPRPGRYELMKGAVFYGWMLRSLLRRILLLPLVRWPLFSSNVLRFLALNAMGAKVAFTVNMSADVDLLDPWLLEVEPGATIGARSLISGHYVEGRTLILGTVRIGRGSLLAADVLVGPGVSIGEKVVVKARASIGPSVTVGDRADIGGEAALDVGCAVGAGARIGNCAYVGPKVVVGEGGEVPANEVRSASAA